MMSIRFAVVARNVGLFDDDYDDCDDDDDGYLVRPILLLICYTGWFSKQARVKNGDVEVQLYSKCWPHSN